MKDGNHIAREWLYYYEVFINVANINIAYLPEQQQSENLGYINCDNDRKITVRGTIFLR